MHYFSDISSMKGYISVKTAHKNPKGIIFLVSPCLTPSSCLCLLSSDRWVGPPLWGQCNVDLSVPDRTAEIKRHCGRWRAFPFASFAVWHVAEEASFSFADQGVKLLTNRFSIQNASAGCWQSGSECVHQHLSTIVIIWPCHITVIGETGDECHILVKK